LWKLVQNYNYTVEIMSHYRMALSQTVCSDINSTSTASDSTCYPACNRTSTTSARFVIFSHLIRGCALLKER
jgi:hypothetical protein